MATSGWNRPSANKPIAPRKNNSVAKGLIAGLIVVILASIAAYFIFSSPERKPTKEVRQKKNAQIAEVDPSIPKQKVEEEKPVEPPKPAVVTNYNEKGIWYDDKGRPHYKPARIIYPGSNTVINGRPWVPPRAIFNRMSENELDRVLSAEPGERILGETNWKFFEADLKEALIEPIRIDPEDTPEEIERKNAVKAAKKELAVAIGNGESPSKILKDAQEDLNKLADFYDGLNRELYEARTSGEMGEQDYEDYVAAANKLLESKNILSKRFFTPAEIREKAEAAQQRRLEKQRLNQ